MSTAATTAGAGSAPSAHPLSRFLPGFDAPLDSRVHGILLAEPMTPTLVREVLETVPVCSDGYAAPVFVLDPDAARGDAAIAAVPEASRGRVRRFVGEGFAERFLEDVGGRLEYGLPRHVIGSNPTCRSWLGGVVQGIQALGRLQVERTSQTRERLAGRWASRGMAHWASRFDAIASGEVRLRAMVVTTRYSTFIRHSAADLASSLESLGHETALVIEPEPCWLAGPLQTLDVIDRFDPDVIVVINYPRATHEAMFPQGWPYVCWVQDAMTHLFKTDHRGGALDFLAGHLYDDLVARAGYPASACLEHPVCASSAKFHPSPSDAASEYDCDLAYVSHQSEPVDVFHERILSESAVSVRPLLEVCRAEVERAIGEWPVAARDVALGEAWRRVASSIGAMGVPEIVAVLQHQYVFPLAERLLRHETLEWAADVARSEGLTLRLYGKGWSSHPTLSEFAVGEIAHGDALRACYQGARVHLHASVRGSGHQRVYECAMSGGLPLCRRSWGEWFRHEAELQKEFVESGRPPEASLLAHRTPAWRISSHPELIELIGWRERSVLPEVGWDHTSLDGLFARLDDSVFPYWLECEVPPAPMRPLRVLGDPFELTFSTRDELAERVRRAVSDPGWRSEVSGSLRGRVERTVSMTAFARNLTAMVTERLRSGATS